MAAGTFTTQNKVRPGVYVQFGTEGKPLGTVSERGVVTLPLSMSWGEPHKVLTIKAGEEISELLGYALTEPQLLLVNEALKRAGTLLLYRLNAGVKAVAIAGNLTATAKWGGARGNNLTVSITEKVDAENVFTIDTLLDGKVVDTQNASQVAELASNAWLDFSGAGALAETAGIPLINGSDGTVTNQEYLDYLEIMEVHDFNTMALPVTDSVLKAAAASFSKRLREEEGKKIQVVVENYPSADYEGIISVKNGVVLETGTVLTPAQATAWVAGATAAAQMDESLTFSAYEGAVDVSPRYTNTQIITALVGGEFVFTASDNTAVVEQDINTLTSFTAQKGKVFAKNRVLRVLDGINQDFVEIFSQYYIGKIGNDGDGRNLLKGEFVNYLQTLQNTGAIQNFDSQTDVVVTAGADADSVAVEVYVQPVDAVEKIYCRVVVR